jgi:hypothetical protein
MLEETAPVRRVRDKIRLHAGFTGPQNESVPNRFSQSLLIYEESGSLLPFVRRIFSSCRSTGFLRAIRTNWQVFARQV